MLKLDLVKLNSLAINLTNRFEYINSGGCAFIARFMYKRLLGKVENLQIKYINYRSGDPCNNYDNVGLWNYNTRINTGINCNHAIITFMFNGFTYCWDTDHGLNKLYEYLSWARFGNNIDNVDYKDVITDSDYNKGWNDWFQRWQVEEIERIIDNAELFCAA